MDEHKLSDKELSEWLDALRKHSWEIEILIIGFVFIGILQLPGVLKTFTVSLLAGIDENAVLANLIGTIYRISVTGSYVIAANLIILLILRGYWVGLIGLHSAFPQGVNYKKLSFRENFTNFLKKKIPPFGHNIFRLDNICSGIFAITFFVIFISISIGAFLIVLSFLTWLFIKSSTVLPSPINSIAGFIIVIITALYNLTGILNVIDFLGFGILKKIKYEGFSRIYLLFTKILSVITFSYLFRTIYYTLVSNIPAKVLRPAIVLFLVLILSLSWGLEYSEHTYFPQNDNSSTINAVNYENQLSEDAVIQEPVIQSDIIDNELIKLFIPYNPEINADLEKTCPGIIKFKRKVSLLYVPFDNIKIEDEDVIYALKCYSNFYVTSIDDSVRVNSKLNYYRHPNKNEPGFLSYIDISNLNKGTHKLTIHENSGERELSSIIFYKN